MWVFTTWPTNIPSDDQLWFPLIWSELETTRVFHQTQHLCFLEHCMVLYRHFYYVLDDQNLLQLGSSFHLPVSSCWGRSQFSTSDSSPGCGCSHSEQRPPENKFVWNVSLQEKVYLSENVTNYQQNFKSNLWRVKFASNLLSGKTNGEIKFHIVHWGPGSFQDPPRWSAWSWGATSAGRSAPRVWGGRALWRDTGPAKRIEFNIFWGGQRTCSTLFKFHHLLFIMLMSSLRHRVSAIPARRGSPFWGRRGPSRSWQLCCTRLGTAARSPGGQPW